MQAVRVAVPSIERGSSPRAQRSSGVAAAAGDPLSTNFGRDAPRDNHSLNASRWVVDHRRALDQFATRRASRSQRASAMKKAAPRQSNSCHSSSGPPTRGPASTGDARRPGARHRTRGRGRRGWRRDPVPSCRRSRGRRSPSPRAPPSVAAAHRTGLELAVGARTAQCRCAVGQSAARIRIDLVAGEQHQQQSRPRAVDRVNWCSLASDARPGPACDASSSHPGLTSSRPGGYWHAASAKHRPPSSTVTSDPPGEEHESHAPRRMRRQIEELIQRAFNLRVQLLSSSPASAPRCAPTASARGSRYSATSSRPWMSIHARNSTPPAASSSCPAASDIARGGMGNASTAWARSARARPAAPRPVARRTRSARAAATARQVQGQPRHRIGTHSSHRGHDARRSMSRYAAGLRRRPGDDPAPRRRSAARWPACPGAYRAGLAWATAAPRPRKASTCGNTCVATWRPIRQS